MSHIEAPRLGLRERKRRATHRRLAEEAARLVTIHGIASTTVDHIADAADVSRATFFRYFESKETAVAEGFSLPWVDLLLDVLRQQPVDLSPVDALIATFAEVGKGFDEAARDVAFQQARISQTSPSLQAWLLSAYVKDELLIGEVIAPRFHPLAPDDPRPRLVGAIAMAAVRIGLDAWVAADGKTDLSLLLQRALAFIEIDTHGQPPLHPTA